VQAYAQAQKFDLVMVSQGVVYSASNIDITPNVLAVLKVSSAAPAAAPAPAGK
jgi:Skp family chaperone for outer membrane proteins